MASIISDPGGRRRIQFSADGSRKCIRLGKMAKKAAEVVKTKIEAMVAAALARTSLDDETSRWLGILDTVMTGKLVAVGLIPRRERQETALGAFLNSYIASRSDVKSATTTVYQHTQRCLIEYFGAAKPLQEITLGDADQWRLWLHTHEKLADNTIRRRFGIARQFLRAAIRLKLVAENPFGDLNVSIRRNDKRYYFITIAEAKKVLDACPDAEWRLLFALSRYGGLRCPSEHLGLRWCDVDWERGRITVRSPKTEHHVGGESRQIPIFPELRPYLEEVKAMAEPGAYWVITRYRKQNANLRTRLERIIRRAGLVPWPKLFQNLRSTRETELTKNYPLHVVTAWIGNSAVVAAKHYLQVTDSDFQEGSRGGAKSGANESQNRARQASVPVGMDSQETTQALVEQGPMPNAAKTCVTTQVFKVGVTGLEPVTSTV
jgi:integrase